MARIQLMMALDTSRDKRVSHERYFYRKGGQWYMVRCGPGYTNIYHVTEYSPEEEEVMKRDERGDGV